HITSLEICSVLISLIAITVFIILVYNHKVPTITLDLGTSLSHLQVMWMSRCCLQDLDGISIYTSLRELYVAYNRVSDLSQVGLLENLQLLDLEGNDVDDLVQVQYLGLCSQLRILTLDGNPVCLRPNTTSTQVNPNYSYRAAVRELIPQLRYLDDVKVEEDGQSDCSTMGKDWEILQNSIKDCNTTTHAACEEGLYTLVCAGKILFCGNPVKAMRAKREKLRVSVSNFCS
uniref:Leucine rich repeat containing 56 n=1 Tax=Gouania willdenowi TaxID=441366 RepID=A0A8C5EDD2_GOUWI